MSLTARVFLSATTLAALMLSAVLFADVPKPVIPPAKGEQCVEPTDVIRKNHMKFLMHQRDDTVLHGIRTKKHSLVECINCHVQPDETGAYPEITSKEHFCNSCHSYASVKVDCFQCHMSKPESAVSMGSEHK